MYGDIDLFVVVGMVLMLEVLYWLVNNHISTGSLLGLVFLAVNFILVVGCWFLNVSSTCLACQ